MINFYNWIMIREGIRPSAKFVLPDGSVRGGNTYQQLPIQNDNGFNPETGQVTDENKYKDYKSKQMQQKQPQPQKDINQAYKEVQSVLSQLLDRPEMRNVKPEQITPEYLKGIISKVIGSEVSTTSSFFQKIMEWFKNNIANKMAYYQQVGMNKAI